MLQSKPLCYTGECACGNGGAAPPRRASGRAAVSLRQAQIHSATSHRACAQSSIEALTTHDAALRSEVALLETEHASRARAGHILELNLLAAQKLLEEERAYLS